MGHIFVGVDAADIATHMARSHQPQSTDHILRSLNHREDALANWPELDITLFISRVSGINPDTTGSTTRSSPGAPS